MSGVDLMVSVLGGIAIVGAAVVVFGRSLIHNALAFTAMLLAVAGVFAALGAGFLAMVQVFVYVGGVVVLILFGIMLTASEPGAPVRVDSRHALAGGVAAAGLAVLAMPSLATLARGGTDEGLRPGSAESIGTLLLTDYAVAFEVLGVVLLVAALAAIVIVRWGASE